MLIAIFISLLVLTHFDIKYLIKIKIYALAYILLRIFF